MEKDNKFLLLSLNQKESKDLAQTLSNETSRKILDYLTEKEEASSSEISKNLNIPLPTVHYNLKQLVKANLVESKEFVWSKKGKEMDIYRLAKKLVIIAPKSTSLKEIKNLLPIAIISIVAAFFIKLFYQTRNLVTQVPFAAQVDEALKVGAAESAISTNISNLTTKNIDYQIIQTIPQPWLWFLYGALFVILLTLIFVIIKRR